MNRPNELLKEIQELSEISIYGCEISKKESKELLNYISTLEKALDKACDSLCSYDRFDDGWSSEQWKEWALSDE